MQPNARGPEGDEEQHQYPRIIRSCDLPGASRRGRPSLPPLSLGSEIAVGLWSFVFAAAPLYLPFFAVATWSLLRTVFGLGVCERLAIFLAVSVVLYATHRPFEVAARASLCGGSTTLFSQQPLHLTGLGRGTRGLSRSTPCTA